MRLLLLLATFASLNFVCLGQQPTPSPNSTQTPAQKTEGPSQNCPDVEPLRRNVAQLNSEVLRLRRRVADLEKKESASNIQEQLEKEEQRGEALQQHLFEIAEKEGPLSARMDQINQQINPETIQRSMAGVGSVHPEEVREEVKKRLANEKIRIQAQLDLLKQDQRRTQASLATTDVSIQRLKQKLAEAQRPDFGVR